MPNLFAHAMLYIWPVIMIILFKKMTPDRALIWSLLGAFLFMPTGVSIDLPLIPILDKHTIPSIMALILCLTMVDQRIRIFPPSVIVSVFMIGYVLSPLPTMLTNREPFIDGVVFMPGQTIRDVISFSMQYAITLIPFVLAFNLLSTREAAYRLLTIYMIAGLIYSIPMLLEVRLAPQLNYWVYGFFPDLFAQQIRFGGFRPVVFMGHGLTVASFAMFTVLSTAILWRGSKSENRLLYAYAMVYLLFVLILCKTVGAIIFAVLFLPIIFLAGVRMKGWAIMVCAILVLTYPVLRSIDVFPTDELVNYAELIQEERAQSLEFRFDNEELLLDHAAIKPLFGWGFWDRNRLWDPETGDGYTVADGYWIGVIGILGWTGYVCIFGLLTLPLFRLWWQRGNPVRAAESHLVYGTALLLAINLIDLLPNSGITNMTWLITGLLLAHSFETRTAKSAEPVPATAPPADVTPVRYAPQPRVAQHVSTPPTTKHYRKKRVVSRVLREPVPNQQPEDSPPVSNAPSAAHQRKRRVVSRILRDPEPEEQPSESLPTKSDPATGRQRGRRVVSRVLRDPVPDQQPEESPPASNAPSAAHQRRRRVVSRILRDPEPNE